MMFKLSNIRLSNICTPAAVQAEMTIKYTDSRSNKQLQIDDIND
jgi:hypothetical protein